MIDKFKERELKMKLGTETGSLVNHVYSQSSVMPKVGEGMTQLSWSDRHAYEVLEVTEEFVRVQRYISKRTDKNYESEIQEYEYNELDGHDSFLVFRKGFWYWKNKWIDYSPKYYKENLKDLNSVEFWNKTKDYYDENNRLKLVKGVTRIATTYIKANVIFGVKEEYYDFSF